MPWWRVRAPRSWSAAGRRCRRCRWRECRGSSTRVRRDNSAPAAPRPRPQPSSAWRGFYPSRSYSHLITLHCQSFCIIQQSYIKPPRKKFDYLNIYFLPPSRPCWCLVLKTMISDVSKLGEYGLFLEHLVWRALLPRTGTEPACSMAQLLTGYFFSCFIYLNMKSLVLVDTCNNFLKW